MLPNGWRGIARKPVEKSETGHKSRKERKARPRGMISF
jgi:hypothetical protein